MIDGRKYWRHGLIFSLIGFLVIGLIYYKSNNTNAAEETWLEITPRPVLMQLGLMGRLEAAQQITITAPFDGVILEKAVEDGQIVQSGQVLFRLSTDFIDSQLRDARMGRLKADGSLRNLAQWPQSQEVGRARRSLATLELNLAENEHKLADTRVLFERGIVPRMEVDALEQQVKLQKLELSAAQTELQQVLAKGQGEDKSIAELESANAKAKYDVLYAMAGQAQIKAAFPGIVGRPPLAQQEKNQEPFQLGAKVIRGQPLLSLSDTRRLRVLSRIEEIDINRVHLNQAVEVTGDAFPGLVLQGRISHIAPQASQSDATAGPGFDVVVELPTINPEQAAQLRLGMSCKLAITLYRAEQAMVLPFNALQQQADGLYVTFAQVRGGKTQLLPVKAGHSLPEGLEVSGLPRGYIRIPNLNHGAEKGPLP